eukprot:642730-Rhodomonas_salina.2
MTHCKPTATGPTRLDDTTRDNNPVMVGQFTQNTFWYSTTLLCYQLPLASPMDHTGSSPLQGIKPPFQNARGGTRLAVSSLPTRQVNAATCLRDYYAMSDTAYAITTPCPILTQPSKICYAKSSTEIPGQSSESRTSYAVSGTEMCTWTSVWVSGTETPTLCPKP